MRRLLPALFLLALCATAHAQIAVGACKTGVAGHSNGLATPACSLSAGQLVYIGCVSFGGTLAATPVSDSVGGNTWVQDSTLTTAPDGSSKVALFHSVLTNGGASMTAHCSWTTAVDSGVAWVNFTSNAAAGNADGSQTGTGNSTTPATAAITPTQSGDVIVGVDVNGASSPSTTVGSGFILVFNSNSTISMQPINMEYHILTGSTATAATWNQTPADNWGGIAGAYKQASAGPSPHSCVIGGGLIC